MTDCDIARAIGAWEPLRREMKLPFADRATAGRSLARALGHFADQPDALVVALPRGGVPVALEIARALGLQLDLMLVRKLGAPGQPELAMGAIAEGGFQRLNPDVVASLGVTPAQIEATVQVERRELEQRRQAYLAGRPPVPLTGRVVILVDDGLATGATLRVAVAAARARGARRVVVAVPVAASDSLRQLRAEVDEVECLATPAPFVAIGQWYVDFHQLTDDEVRALLQSR